MELEPFLFVAVPGAVYLALIGAPLLFLPSERKPASKAFWGTLALAVGTLALAVGTFISVADSMRPPFPGGQMGSEELEQENEQLDAFLRTARAVFLVLYGAVLAGSGILAFAWGRRRGLWATVIAATTMAAVAGFMIITFPLVNFEFTCDVGVSLVGRPAC